jgi:hypothetical protein
VAAAATGPARGLTLGGRLVDHRIGKRLPGDVASEKEALFNEVYDSEHVPNLLKVPGVRSVTRLRTKPAASASASRRSS